MEIMDLATNQTIKFISIGKGTEKNSKANPLSKGNVL